MSVAIAAANLQGRKRTVVAAVQSGKRPEERGLQLATATRPKPVNLRSVEADLRRLAAQLGISDIEFLTAIYETEVVATLTDVAAQTRRQLQIFVNNLIAIGLPTGEAVQALAEQFDVMGLSAANPYQLETIYRTQTQVAYQAGRWTAAQDPDIDEILWGYRYRTVGDNRVRPEHEILDGVTLPKGDPFWLAFWPPNGFNCRCQVIELFEPARIVAPPVDAAPDQGFAFNPGVVLAV